MPYVTHIRIAGDSIIKAPSGRTYRRLGKDRILGLRADELFRLTQMMKPQP